MLELACRILRRLQRHTDLEKYTTPLLKSWEGTFPRTMTNLRKTQAMQGPGRAHQPGRASFAK
eukprot:110165-Prorocentrum_lima.AAC.1